MGPIIPWVWTSPVYRELEELLTVKANYTNNYYKMYLAGMVLHP